MCGKILHKVKIYYKATYTYKIFRMLQAEVESFVTTLGNVALFGLEFLKGLKSFPTTLKAIMEQASRFGVSSLPITLVGMLVAILMVREEGVIMAGFAIISMIGSSMASEIATMKVTEQIDAIRVLKVNPVHYLFTPRVIAGTLMMPLVVIVASVFGILGGAVASNLVSGLTYKAYFDSVWFGLNIHDINVCILKSLAFGFVITLISCTCGMEARDGAKGVGIATTKAVVWSFVAIVILDLIFAAMFFY